MLRPVIMVGCGGSGQKAVRYVRDSVDRHLRHAGWDEGFPRAWRFLGLDTLTTQEAPGEIPTMPETDYISVSLNHTIYSHVEDELLANYPRESESYRELIGWRPAPTEVTVPLVDGAGQMRAVGRIASIRSMVNVVRPKLQKAFTACRDGGPELQSVSESLGLKVTPGSEVPDPIVVVVGSMAGGTGAGIMLDVIDLIRRTDTRGAFPISIVFTPDIFGLGDTSGMSANGLAFMSELMASYWDQQLDRSTLIPPLVRVDKSGPHAVFMIGRKNTRGLDLGDSIHVYRAVGEALASWVTSSSVQEEVINFITVNWQAAAKENMGGYPFGHGFQPGVVSSFGAATLSIGRDRFFDYAVKLIMREMVFHLHEGHRRRSRAELGARAEGYSEQRIVEELLEENKKRFLNDCGLDERGEDANQIIDRFASQEMTKDEASRVRRSISQSLEGPDPLEGQSWKRRIKSQAVVAGNESQHRSSEWFRQRSGEWAPEIFQKILWVVSDYLGRYGLKTTARLVTATQAEVNEVADEVRNEASQDNRKAERLQDKADDYLKGVGSGAVTFKSKPVQDAIQSTAESIALKWRAHLRNEVAKSMEALTGEVLNPIAEQLDMGSYRVNAIVDSDSKKSNEVDISTWPQYGGGVPDSFLPSPLEFFIENPKSWPRMLDDLLDEADEAVNRSDSTYGPRNNVDAARYLLVSGDSSGIRERWSLPLIWAKSYDTEDPKWWPGNHPQIELTDDLELLKKRVEAWLKRPNSRSQRMFSEGLRGYLAETDSVGKMIPDHYERLIRFRQRLSEAKDKSQPLVEIDTTLSGVVHSSGRTAPITPLTEQFPFPGEHPARELVTEVFKDHPSVEFTDKDSESVMISSFVPSPLHPMVIPSFTRPLAMAINRIGNRVDRMQGSFWLYRRARDLKGFVPVPNEVFMAFLRGFAVARMVGCITADPTSPVQITPLPSSSEPDDMRPLEFPFPLLTAVDPSNILPALLEAFPLCFGRVPTDRHKAFKAYEQLYRYGQKLEGDYRLPREVLEYLTTGAIPMEPVDREIFSRMSGPSEENRSENLIGYLEINLARLSTLSGRALTGREHRRGTGSISPDASVLTIEICSHLIEAYQEVYNSLVNRSDVPVV